MPTYEVRLLMEHDADTPLEAVQMFIQAIVDEGFKGFMYRVQDLENDPEGFAIALVQHYQTMTLQQAADKFGLDLDLEEIDEDEDDTNDDANDDADSVVSNVNE